MIIFDKIKERFSKDEKDELDLQIQSTLSERDKYEPGSKEWNALNQNLPEFYKIKVEADDVKSRKIINKIKTGAEIGIGVLTLGLYKKYLDKGFEFEKEGTFTSSTFRNLINKIRPNK